MADSFCARISRPRDQGDASARTQSKTRPKLTLCGSHPTYVALGTTNGTTALIASALTTRSVTLFVTSFHIPSSERHRNDGTAFLELFVFYQPLLYFCSQLMLYDFGPVCDCKRTLLSAF
jgi:hypothetical protein